MAERYIEIQNMCEEVRSRAAASVGEKTVQHGHTPAEIGDVEGGDASLMRQAPEDREETSQNHHRHRMMEVRARSAGSAHSTTITTRTMTSRKLDETSWCTPNGDASQPQRRAEEIVLPTETL